MSGTIKIIGHRGAKGLAPENSIPSIKKALELGVDMVEIDVHCTSDGAVVVIHDETVDRTTNGKGKISSFTLNKLKLLHITDSNGNETEQTVPTLDEVFQAMDGKAILLIEIKKGNDTYPKIEEKVIEHIKLYNAMQNTIVQSFDDKVIERIHALEPAIEIHKLFYGNILGMGVLRKNLKHYEYVSAFNPYFKGVNKRFIRKVHAMGKKVNCWTVDAEKDMQKAIEKGMDGIITNRPDLLSGLIGK